MQIENIKASGNILISNKVDFKTRSISRKKKNYFIMIKELINKEYITIISAYVPITEL